MSHFCWDDIDLIAGRTVAGEIVSVDRENMTAVVKDIGLSNLDNIPIHYHCDEDDTKDNGECIKGAYPDYADEKGAGAFAVGDKVSVIFRGMNRARPMIIGFTGDDKKCCNFRFSLQGSDGEELSEGVIFSIFDEDQNSLPVIKVEYDEDEEYWTFTLDIEADMPLGEYVLEEGEEANKVECVGPFWAKYFKGGYKHTQYQGINESSGFFLEGDRVIYGDGTLYADVLEVLTAAEGEFWEDWSEGICGKNTWNGMSFYSRVSPHVEADASLLRGPCLPSPSIVSDSASGVFGGGNSSFSYEIKNEVLTLSSSTSWGGEAGGAIAAGGVEYTRGWQDMYIDTWDGDLPSMAMIRMYINFPAVVFSLAGDSFGDILLTVQGYRQDSDQIIYLYYYIKYCYTYGEDVEQGSDVDEGDHNIWIGDDIVLGEPFEINVTDDVIERGLDSFDTNRPLSGMSFTIYTGSQDSGGNAQMSLSVDHIDIPRWEDWSEGFLGTNDWERTLNQCLGGDDSYFRLVQAWPNITLPVYGTASGQSSSISLSNEIVTLEASSVDTPGGLEWSMTWLDYYRSSGNWGRYNRLPPCTGLIVNFASVVDGLHSTSSDGFGYGRIAMGLGDHWLDLFFAYTDYGKSGSDCEDWQDDFDHNIWIGDETISGQEFEIDFRDYDWWSDDIGELWWFGFVLTSHAAGSVSCSIDYIDFP